MSLYDDKRAARAAARSMQHLDPGPLAELRRTKGGIGTPEFWRLAAQYPGAIGRQDMEERWMDIIRILAILTPKGDRDQRPPLHDPKRRLGTVLCDGGDPGWPPKGGGKPRPVFSERRLTQFMAARGAQRGVLLERAARMLMRSRKPESGVDVVDVALVLLKPEDGRRLAAPYYRRLDRAERGADEPEEGTI